MAREKDQAGVRFPPPLVFLGFLLLGPLIERFVQVPRLDVPWPIGAAIAAAGVALVIVALGPFWKTGQDPAPWTPSGSVIDTGIYAHSRNPMYLGMALIHLGLAIVLHSWTALLLLPVAILVIRTQVIAREERYLEGKFGAAYTDYKRRVRRWL